MAAPIDVETNTSLTNTPDRDTGLFDEDPDRDTIIRVGKMLELMRGPLVRDIFAQDPHGLQAMREGEGIIKAFEAKIAYRESHPEDDVQLYGFRTDPQMPADVFSRLGLQTRRITAHHDIIKHIREELARRGRMQEIDDRLEMARYVVQSTNKGFVSVMCSLVFPLMGPNLFATELKLNRGDSPSVVSVKNTETGKQMITLFRGPIEIEWVVFNHDSPSTGAKNRLRMRDTPKDKKDFVKKIDALAEGTTDIRTVVRSSEIYQNMFKDEYLNIFTEFKRAISISISSVVVETHTLMVEAGSKRTMWLLTNGLEWVFGVVSIEESGQTVCYISDIKTVTTGDEIRDMLLTVIYWGSTPSSEVLKLYDITQEA